MNSSYNKKYILVLGGSGFLGSNIIDYYRTYISDSSTDRIVFVIVGKSSQINSGSDIIYFQVDFTNSKEIDKLMSKYNFDEVFHFISSSVPSTSNYSIKDDIQSNLIGTINLLENMVKYKINKIIYLSSGGTIYGENSNLVFQEDLISSQTNSYGILKMAIENYIKLYNKVHNINFLILRISNPFGAFHRSNLNGFVNIAIRKSINNEPIEIWGDGSISKDYIFCDDLSKIFWDLHKFNISNEVLNVGSGNSYSLLDIVKYIKLLLPDTKLNFQDKKVFDTVQTSFKIDKLKKIINIENTDMLNAIKKTYNWEINKIK